MNGIDRNIRDDIAENERWLAGFNAPGASRELLDNIKQAMRTELTRQRSRRRWSAWQGAAASAAIILLAVGVGWLSTQVKTNPADAPLAMIDAEEITDSLEAMSLGDGYTDWASATDDAWAVSATALYDDWEAAMSGSDTNGLDDTGAMLPTGSAGQWAEEIG